MEVLRRKLIFILIFDLKICEKLLSFQQFLIVEVEICIKCQVMEVLSIEISFIQIFNVKLCEELLSFHGV